MPEEPEPKGLLALMLSCTARRQARRDASGRFVPLDRQDARLWDKDQIIEAEALLTAAARAGRFGRYQCKAAFQSVHIQRPITARLNLHALRFFTICCCPGPTAWAQDLDGRSSWPTLVTFRKPAQNWTPCQRAGSARTSRGGSPTAAQYCWTAARMKLPMPFRPRLP